MIYSYHVQIQFEHGFYEGFLPATDDASAIREIFAMYGIPQGQGPGNALVKRHDSVVIIKYEVFC